MLQARLDEKGWSLRDFAAKLDPRRSTDSLVGYVSKIVTGKVRPPLKQLDRWADHLRLDGAQRERFILLAKLARGDEDIEASFLNLERRLEEVERAARARGLLPGGPGR